MLKYMCLFCGCSCIGNAVLFKIGKHRLIGFRPMLHHMIISYPVAIQMFDGFKMLGRDSELAGFQSLLIRNISADAFHVSNPIVIRDSLKMSKRIHPLFDSTTRTDACIKITISQIDVANYSQHTLMI